MNILVINAGSTSLKFKFFKDEKLVMGGNFRNVDDSKFDFFDINKNQSINIEEEEYINAIKHIKEWVEDYGHIDKIGFRVVHGGEKFKKTVKIDDIVLEEIEELCELAPLHNPPAVDAIKQSMKLFPNVDMYAVFDTEFHTNLPEKAYLYGIPYKFYKEYGIRRFGFHGISHEYLAEETGKLLLETSHPNPAFDKSNTYTDVKMITLHLGGGASIAAIRDGKSVDTSMGFTPMEGLMMSTRAGDVDDGVLTYLRHHLGYSIDQISEIINKESGLLGVSGISGDMKKLLAMEARGIHEAHRAIELYIYKIVKYVGSYVAALGGVEAITFSGAVGSGSSVIRERVCNQLKVFGIEIDKSQNDDRPDIKEPIEIGKGIVRIFAMPTDEELMISRKISRF